MKNNLRSIEKTDLAAAVDLLNRSLAFDQITACLLKEKLWDEPNFKSKLALVVEVDGRLVGLAAAVIREKSGGRRGYIKLIAVDPDHRKQGIGEQLLNELEKQISRLTKWIRLGESAPNYLWPGLDPHYTEAMVFFERRGYNRFNDSRNLTVDCENLAEAQATFSGISIRRALATDRKLCRQFVQDNWPAWVGEVSVAFDNDPISLHLAFAEDTPIAFAGYDCNNRGTGWFGPMGTSPGNKRKGIGRVLLLRCLADIRNQGLSRAVIPWVGPVGFYNRAVGAVVDRIFYRHEKRSI